VLDLLGMVEQLLGEAPRQRGFSKTALSGENQGLRNTLAGDRLP